MRKTGWLLPGLVLFLVLGICQPVAAANPGYFLSASVEVHFGSSVDFQLQTTADPVPDQLWLFLQPEGSDIILLEVPFASHPDNIRFSLEPAALPLRAFGDVAYWFQAEFNDGTHQDSEEYHFTYQDDRFPWHALQTDHFRLYWYEGDLAFGTLAVNTAENSYTRLTSEFGDVFSQEVIDVFLYASHDALQDTLSVSAYGWVAGHADPELGQMLMSITPGADQKSEMERQIPHELAHLFTYQATGQNYRNQPVWLLEGIATNAQLNQDPAYVQLLDTAAAENALIPLGNLCDDFPAQGNDVYLAYAEAESFVRYLKDHYGNHTIQALLEEYASGTTCESGFQNVYSISLMQMETRWQQQTLQMHPFAALLEQMLPYLGLIMMVVLVPVLLSMIGAKTAGKMTDER